MERKCDICGWEYELVKKDLGGFFAPIFMSDDIRIYRYREGTSSVETYKVCPGCAGDISKFIQKQIITYKEL